MHNSVTWDTITVVPTRGECRFTVRMDPTPQFLRGDPNDDGRNDIADAIWIVAELFRGGPETDCRTPRMRTTMAWSRSAIRC